MLPDKDSASSVALGTEEGPKVLPLAGRLPELAQPYHRVQSLVPVGVTISGT